MKKFNLSEIMKYAWELFKMYAKSVAPKNFSECLKKSWKYAKQRADILEKLQKDCMTVVDGCKMYMRRGVIACAGVCGWIVSGKTYYSRKHLKKFGFCFDGESKTWYTEDINVAENFLYL